MVNNEHVVLSKCRHCGEEIYFYTEGDRPWYHIGKIDIGFASRQCFDGVHTSTYAEPLTESEEVRQIMAQYGD